MRLNHFLTSILLLPILFFSASTMAVGLGELQSDSRLGQKLMVTIPITLGNENINLEDLKANLKMAGSDSLDEGDRYRNHYNFEVGIIESSGVAANGKRAYHIKIRSKQVIVEPYVSLPVHLSWPGGMLRREYTVLFD